MAALAGCAGNFTAPLRVAIRMVKAGRADDKWIEIRDSFWNLSSIHRVFVGDAGGLTAPGSCG
ncbi:hypothetical protein JQW92_24750 [Sulfitobacter pseudonitzschiae]|uniref:hypothetical protein n=1 Tax=Pseudosulfitobacter pseudonitzschiae TaxID=1402135 RepID=UPI001AF3AAA3|nr:hypothetical protein [Pseudosulfitobacter pseudonitzschiae]MBM1912848.1 hypothetical protein [Pseudosulfitobacter pseudonitzschiae]MBM1961248.1 hypothetical protein [Pseudosulfitobacter pseudonitzschiae]MBM1995062.1 hypothetical protein [Pseudosulfitobacter pseudonitzschiae]MBM2087248.1 hypothetical protein [Pseudosulfitobacter pseudonitzschiae]MBM2309853.1 hypothetical protein [Pseudosulfitobacter pseudonitzschiae]